MEGKLAAAPVATMRRGSDVIEYGSKGSTTPEPGEMEMEDAGCWEREEEGNRGEDRIRA